MAEQFIQTRGLSPTANFGQVSQTLGSVGSLLNSYLDREARKEQQLLQNRMDQEKLDILKAQEGRDTAKFAAEQQAAGLLANIPTVGTKTEVVSPAIPARETSVVSNLGDIEAAKKAQEKASLDFSRAYEEELGKPTFIYPERVLPKATPEGVPILYERRKGTPGNFYTVTETAEGKPVGAFEKLLKNYEVMTEQQAEDYLNQPMLPVKRNTTPEEAGRIALLRSGITDDKGNVLLGDIPAEIRESTTIPARAAVTREVPTELSRTDYFAQGQQLLRDRAQQIQSSDMTPEDKQTALLGVAQAQQQLLTNAKSLFPETKTPSAALMKLQQDRIYDRDTLDTASRISGKEVNSLEEAKAIIKRQYDKPKNEGVSLEGVSEYTPALEWYDRVGTWDKMQMAAQVPVLKAAGYTDSQISNAIKNATQDTGYVNQSAFKALLGEPKGK